MEEQHCSTVDRSQLLSQVIDDELCNANVSSSIDAADLEAVSYHIGLPFPCHVMVDNEQNTNSDMSMCVVCSIVDLRRRINLIKSTMGSMAQCRGARGESLREAGAIDSLLSIVWRLILSSDEENIHLITLPAIGNESSEASYNAFDTCCCERHSQSLFFDNKVAIKEEIHSTSIDLASAALGSLRDLACGSALNRAAFLLWEPSSSSLQTHNKSVIKNGVHVLVAYIQRYDGLSWEDIMCLGGGDAINATRVEGECTYTTRGKKEIRMLTNALGAIRNSSHSTADVCQSFYTYDLVDLLIRRLIQDVSTSNNNGSHSVLPDASKPWREACFRTAGSLINLAEKCPDVANKLASNRNIIYILLETWGGANAITCNNEKSNSKKSLQLPLLHLGLAAVLNAAGRHDGLDDVMKQVLEKEKERKKVAQRREEERKLRLKKAQRETDT